MITDKATRKKKSESVTTFEITASDIPVLEMSDRYTHRSARSLRSNTSIPDPDPNEDKYARLSRGKPARKTASERSAKETTPTAPPLPVMEQELEQATGMIPEDYPPTAPSIPALGTEQVPTSTAAPGPSTATTKPSSSVPVDPRLNHLITRKVLDNVQKWLNTSFRDQVQDTLQESVPRHIASTFEDVESPNWTRLVTRVTDRIWNQYLAPSVADSPLMSSLHAIIRQMVTTQPQLFTPLVNSVLAQNARTETQHNPTQINTAASAINPTREPSRFLPPQDDTQGIPAFHTQTSGEAEHTPRIPFRDEVDKYAQQEHEAESRARRNARPTGSRKYPNESDESDAEFQVRPQGSRSRNRYRSNRNYRSDHSDWETPTGRRHTSGRNRNNGPGPSDPSSGSSDDDRYHRRKEGRKYSRHRRRNNRKHYHSSSEDTSDSDRSRERDYRHGYRHGKSRRKNPKLAIIRPTREIFAKAVNYKSYRLQNRTDTYTSATSSRVTKLEKKLKIQMGSHTFSGKDPITVLAFLARFRDACDKNDVAAGIAVWCFQYFLTGSARHLVASRLVGRTMATDADQEDMLSTYDEVVNFLLHTYATEEEMIEAAEDVEHCIQSSNQNEQQYADALWEKALRCGTVYSSNRLKGYFVRGLLEAIRSQVRHHLTRNPDAPFQELLSLAKSLGYGYRAAKRLHRDRHTALPEKTRHRSVLSIDTPDLSTQATEADEVFALTDQNTSTLPSPPTSLTPTASQSPSSGYRQFDPTRTNLYGNKGCRLCLSKDHTVCPLVSPAEREKLMMTRNQNYSANYQQRRVQAPTPSAQPAARRPTYTNRPQIHPAGTPVHAIEENAAEQVPNEPSEETGAQQGKDQEGQ